MEAFDKSNTSSSSLSIQLNDNILLCLTTPLSLEFIDYFLKYFFVLTLLAILGLAISLILLIKLYSF